MNFELVFNGVVVAALIGLFVVSGQMEGVKISTDYLGPSGFPRLVILLSILLMVGQSISLIRGKKEHNSVNVQGLKRAGASVGLLFLYIIAMKFTGYIMSTLVSLFLLGKSIGYKDNFRLSLFSIALTFLLVTVFGYFFSIPLPRGIGFLREISYIFY